MKKIASLIGGLVLLLVVATPAFATGGFFDFFSDDLTIRNWADVTTKTYTKADSGDNSIGGKYVWGGEIKTGDVSAYADIYNDVNGTFVAGCNCFDDVTLRNGADVYTKTYTKADSGDNSIGGYKVGGWWSGDIKIDTGDAGAASIIDTIVNFTMMDAGGAE